jgi:hypothetical protein
MAHPDLRAVNARAAQVRLAGLCLQPYGKADPDVRWGTEGSLSPARGLEAAGKPLSECGRFESGESPVGSVRMK